MTLTLDQLRRYAVARTLFTPTTLSRAINRLGFVQADPIRAPARAQDLILRHRVKGYCAGDLERRYPRLNIEEDFFVNYGFLPRATQVLMHPRTPRDVWPPERQAQAHAVLDYVRLHGVVHPRQVDAHFAHGSALNWFGGHSKVSTQLLDDMHHRGMVRIAGRASGVRTYAAQPPLSPACKEASASAADPGDAMDALVDVILGLYAPLPERSLGELIGYLKGGVPQWRDHRRAAFQRAKLRLPSANVEGVTWFWPEGETPASPRHAPDDAVRLLAPFDPVVWDRRRFELLWGWAYRFEAYTPAPKRVRGYYALPLLWREQVIGWGNLAVKDDALKVDLGFVDGREPQDPAFTSALTQELASLRSFLGLPAVTTL
jgi:uncharacterized protein